MEQGLPSRIMGQSCAGLAAEGVACAAGAFVVASQEAKDFDPSLFTAVANYLALRLSETDAKLMAKTFAAADKVGLYTDRIKQMPNYRGMYYGEGLRTPINVALLG